MAVSVLAGVDAVSDTVPAPPILLVVSSTGTGMVDDNDMVESVWVVVISRPSIFDIVSVCVYVCV